MIIIEIRPCLLTYFVFACLPFYAWQVFFSYLDINCAEEAIYLQPIGHLVVFIVLKRPEHVRTCWPPHRGSKCLKPPKFKFTWSHFANFSSNYFYDFRFRCLNVFHIQSLSNCCKNDYDQSITRICRLIIGGIFLLGPTVLRRAKAGKQNLLTFASIS